MEHDEQYGVELLRALAREPRTPSTVDVSRAVVDGERRQRAVRLVSSGAAVATVLLVVAGGWAVAGARRHPDPVSIAPPGSTGAAVPASATASAPTRCVLERLAVPAGQPAETAVTGADPTGRYVLGVARSVLIWDNGQPRQITLSGTDPQLHDITSTGIAVGTSSIGSAEQTAAWAVQGGKVTRLAGGNAAANGINERGTIVGSVNGKPAMWSSPTAQPIMLALPAPGWSGWAIGIDEDGTVVGNLSNSQSQSVFVWQPDSTFVWHPDGTVQQLAAPTVHGKPATTYTAFAIRDGWVTGSAGVDVPGMRFLGAPRWNLRTGTVETPESPGWPVRTESINGHGWVVGEAADSRAVLVADGKAVDLPGLGNSLDPQAGGPGQKPYIYPRSISDDGKKVAGMIQLSNATPVAVVWTCQ